MPRVHGRTGAAHIQDEWYAAGTWTCRSGAYEVCEMDMWLKIGSAMLLVMMLVMLWPSAKRMMKESPKGSAEDWKGALIPLALVALFIVLLVMAV